MALHTHRLGSLYVIRIAIRVDSFVPIVVEVELVTEVSVAIIDVRL